MEGGAAGGEILVEGTPEKVAKNKKSYTAKFLREELK
jgi:excinuclease ABC subunit A